jgi:FlaA1/EpsC-like NDP-sugar epimerase
VAIPRLRGARRWRNGINGIFSDYNLRFLKKMKALITGSGGLIGSEGVRTLCREGWDIVGIDNDMRAQFFGTR